MRLADRYLTATASELTEVCAQRCGARCCQGRVLVTCKGDEEAARLQDLAASFGKRIAFHRDSVSPYWYHSEQEGGRCPFLGEDKLCAIYEERPIACSNYPFTPDSHGCYLSGWEPKATVFLATPHGRSVPFEWGLMKDLVRNKLIEAGMFAGDTGASSCRVDRNRNLCVEAFLKSGADYLLFLDDDMTFPPEVGVRLASHGVDIACGLYFQRGQGKGVYPHWYRYLGEGPDKYGQMGQQYRSCVDEVYHYIRILPRRNEAMTVTNLQPVEIDAGATGCVLIHRRVLEAMPAPWFRSEGATNGDMQFFYKAKMVHGFKVWGDPGVVCGHYNSALVGVGAFRDAVEGEISGARNCNTPEYWDRVHGFEAESGFRRSYPGSDSVHAHVLGMIERPGPTVVDFGCGRARTYERLKASRPDVLYIGVDHSTAAIEDNRQAYPDATWIVGDVRHLDGSEPSMVNSGVADLVVSNEVIEHMDEPRELLDEMWRVLRPGGYMAVGLPIGEAPAPEGEHVQVFDWDRAIGLLECYGNPVWTFQGDEFRRVAVVQKAEVAGA